MFISGSVPSLQNVYRVSGNIKKKNTENTIFLRISFLKMEQIKLSKMKAVQTITLLCMSICNKILYKP